MSALVTAELLKTRTTRTALALVLGLLAIVAFFGNVHAATLDRGLDSAEATKDNLGALTFVALFALVFGMLASAGEHRHGTISQTYLVTPVRERVVAAKAVSAAVFAGVLWAAASALAVAIAVVWFSARGFDFDAGDAWSVLWPTLVLATFWAPLGVGIGFLLPNQVGAIVVVLSWLFVVEPIVQGLLPGVQRYLPAGLADALVNGDADAIPRAAAAALTAGYALALAGAGAALERRRDVT
jgi:ABC-2 type transport system permease protein